MKQFQYTTRRSPDTIGPFDLAAATARAVNRRALDTLAVGSTWRDSDGDTWERLPDKTESGLEPRRDLPGETIFYVPADRLERIATHVFASMINASPMLSDTVLARTAVDFAKALIAELDKQS